MLAVRKTAARKGVSLDRIPEPQPPGRGEVLIQVVAAGICGSDVHVYEWTRGYEFMQSHFPVVLGHEFSGVVHALGADVSELAVGDAVVVMPGISCMQCGMCARGQPQFCANKTSIGLTCNGAFAAQVVVPALACLPLPPGTDMTLAALTEPLCVGDNAAEVGEVAFGDTVVVLGPGTIGQAAARSARWRGATRVIVVGMNDAPRLKVAERMGATHVIDLAQAGTLNEAVKSATGGQPADVVIEATGHSASIPDGFQVLRKGGILVAAGIHARPVSFDLTAMVRNKQQLRGAHSSHRRTWEIMLGRIAAEPDSVRPMVSLELGLDQAVEGFERCLARDVSKVILMP